jgi:hypothetical protein
MDEPQTPPNIQWTASGIAHRSTMKTLAHLMAWAATLQIHEHDNLTAKFRKREGNCSSVLGDHWKDKQVGIRAKHRLLQSICFQFPCAANFKEWGWQEEDGTPWHLEGLDYAHWKTVTTRKRRRISHGAFPTLLIIISAVKHEEWEINSSTYGSDD